MVGISSHFPGFGYNNGWMNRKPILQRANKLTVTVEAIPVSEETGEEINRGEAIKLPTIVFRRKNLRKLLNETNSTPSVPQFETFPEENQRFEQNNSTANPLLTTTVGNAAGRFGLRSAKKTIRFRNPVFIHSQIIEN